MAMIIRKTADADLEEIFNFIHSAFRGGAESDLV